MNRHFIIIVTTIILSSYFTVFAQTGFVVYSKGSDCARQLTFVKLTDGKLGEEKVAVQKAEGADIWVQISHDGVWVAFGRAIGTFPSYSKHGDCDYHMFDKFDIYIAKIDHGRNLPAKAVKVGHGYWPCWSMDSNKPTKTLYYTVFQSQTINKTIVSPDGTFTEPELHAKSPEPPNGTGSHVQAAPNDKYIAYRKKGRMYVYDIPNNKTIPGAGGGGCHPGWGPRGKYLMWAKNQVCRVDDSGGKGLGKAGLGSYWYGASNDAEYDNGKIYIIGKLGGGKQNGAGSVTFKPVDISGGGWKVGSGTAVGKGNSSDIHIGLPQATSIINRNKLDSKMSIAAVVRSDAVGLKLVITSERIVGYSAGLYDLHGKRKVFLKSSGSSRQAVIPINDISNGMYILRVNAGKVNTQEIIWISR